MIEIRDDVLVTPYESAWVGGPDHSRIPVHGRICRAGEPADEFPEHLRATGAPEVDGLYLYGGPFKLHFGHVMVDSIARLWAFERERHKGVVFAALDTADPPSWFYEILGIFGVAREDVVIVREPVVFRRLEFAEPGSTLRGGPKDWYLDFLGTLPLRLEGSIPGKDLYFGRTHIIHKGALMGESYFGGLLEQSGFRYVCPEQFDIFSQMSMLANAGRIVFTEGSSIYSIELLASTKAEIFMIPRRSAVHLFRPHIAPKARFRVVGDPTCLRRGLNKRGRIKPNSPSFTSCPDRTFQDMVSYRLIGEGVFDAAAFKAAEASDLERYHA